MTLMMSSTPGISAFPESDSNLFHWLGTIVGPDETHYAGLKFKLKIDFVSFWKTLPFAEAHKQGMTWRAEWGADFVF